MESYFPKPKHGEDRSRWEEFRNKYKLFPSGSMVSAGFGASSESLDKVLKKHLGIVAPQENTLILAAMSHGNATEGEAKKAYLNVGKGKREREFTVAETSEYMEYTGVYKIKRERINGDDKENEPPVEIGIVCTPDLLMWDDEDKIFPVEIKCPYYEIALPKKRRGRTILNVCDQFWMNNPYGKVTSFIQAATYAFVLGCDTFKTLYYFKGKEVEERAILMFDYTFKDNLDFLDDLFDSIRELQEKLKEYDECNGEITTVQRLKSSKRKQVESVMSDCMFETFQLLLREESKEKAPQ